MHTYGERDGIKFRINHDGPLGMETIMAIEKMVGLASKIKFKNTNEHNHRQTASKPSHKK